MNTLRINPLAAILCGGIIMGLALGIRHGQGLFLLPMTAERGWSREEFAFAIALQNLLWGLAQPFTGMIADRFGSLRVIFAGCLLYGLGLFWMAHAATPLALTLSGGLAIGMALSATAFGTVYGALARMVPPERRGWALGLAGAVGGLGQFVAVPVAHGFIDGFGWMAALVILALAIAALAPLAFTLTDNPSATVAPGARQGMGSAIGEAFRHRGFLLLNLGFFACGFQLAFIGGHLPAYLADHGMNARAAVIALSLIALANVAGTFLFGRWGDVYRRKHLLAWVYLARSALMVAFLALPLSELSVYVFAFGMGFLWLGTVPLTSGLISQVFGVQYISTLFGFVFVGHQIGGFLGMWLGGRVYDLTGSYDLIWIGAVGIGVVAAALHWPIDDRQVARLRMA
ncbi:MAG TPA: MFS transporter [Noviherbaspirillum sp.]|nr:MFS transporter [Noviherbaspirillum sp.]